jgi:hypothetical protein
MQTFVPITSGFSNIAEVIDNKRLNKQALEGWQIMMTLLELDPQGEHREPKGWRNHPATKMWRGHEVALNSYIQAMVVEWKKRGYKSTIGDKANSTLAKAVELGITSDKYEDPSWLSDSSKFSEIASSHRLALLTKNYEWYSQFDWPEDAGTQPDGYEYVWPVD